MERPAQGEAPPRSPAASAGYAGAIPTRAGRPRRSRIARLAPVVRAGTLAGADTTPAKNDKLRRRSARKDTSLPTRSHPARAGCFAVRRLAGCGDHLRPSQAPARAGGAPRLPPPGHRARGRAARRARGRVWVGLQRHSSVDRASSKFLLTRVPQSAHGPWAHMSGADISRGGPQL